MKPNKKKPRIRNRPRNKANRQQLVETQCNGQPTTNEVDEGVKSEKAIDDVNDTSDSEDDMPDLEDEAETSKLLYVPEEDEAIKTIQSFMLDKTLIPLQICTEPDTPVEPFTPAQREETDKQIEPTTSVQTAVKPLLPHTETIGADTVVKPVASAKIEDTDKPLHHSQGVKADAAAKAVTAVQVVEPDTSAKRTIPKQSAESRKDPKTNASLNHKSAKTKGKPVENNPEQNAFIQNIQKKMEAMMANGDENLPNTLMENLKKLFDQGPVSDIESDGDEDEYVEYIYKPRKYFTVALCNLCKCDLCKLPQMTECSKCHMTYYCCVDHMQNDAEHLQLCRALQQVAAAEDGQIFLKCGDMSAEQFRSYRIITIRKVEAQLNRPLSATEQEVILFPRLCMTAKCRQSEFNALKDCPNCGMVAFCAQQPEHLTEDHQKWCESYQLFKEFVMFQEQFGKLDPSLPTKILKDTPLNCNTTKQIFCKLGFDLPHNCEYAALTQISTAPLTAWYALKLCKQLKLHQDLTIHLIGAEIEFEVDVLHKWELFFLHITPTVQNLNVVFVGPELNPNNILLEQFQKTKCCIGCRKNNRSVKYYFESSIYHDYCRSEKFLKPNLICFFNAGIYRSTGYNMEDTWPETIVAASNRNVPIVVTAYTEYESPLDIRRFLDECQRDIKIIQKPTENPFASVKPERNFISDNEAPLMFKNFFCFVVE